MSEHLAENLPRLLTGDATRSDVMAAAEHLRTCPDCQQELVSAVVAHASLTSAHRFAPDIVAPAKTTADLDDAAAAPSLLPDLSAVFASARAEASARSARPGSAKRGRILAVAAAAVVLTGAGVTIAETVGGSDSPAGTRTVVLDAFGHGTKSARATVVDNHTMHIDASALPKLDAGHAYEVWLTDSQLAEKLPIGPIGSDNTAQLTVSPKVMAQYADIVVSVQPRSDQTKYSGISVLRGAYSSD